ncbi:MAG: agmatinase family protein [Rikenellaceae bacterium]
MSIFFDPNDISIANGNYFALPYTPQDSDLVLLSVPWDVTTSYGEGTSLAPDAIIAASEQIDLYDFHGETIYERGIGTLPIEENTIEISSYLRKDAKKVITALSEGVCPSHESIHKRTSKINIASEELNNSVYQTSTEWIKKGKIVGLVGGDHSTPLGLFKAVCENYENVGILHIDAHADLREAYEGFKYSHASIMYNALNETPQLTKLVQVGIRDFCEQEIELIKSNDKIETFFDLAIAEKKASGITWIEICKNIIEKLPQNVHISFDIDGLTPDNCPSTGTPVPGGLSFNEAVILIHELVKSGRKIVGFDLTEVTPCEENEWDANVGARMLYKLCNMTLLSNKGDD